MFEVGKTCETKKGTSETCIAVSDKFAFMQSHPKGTPYAWTHDGKALSLGEKHDIKLTPREYWLDPISLLAYGYPLPGSIHVREVLPE